MTDEELIARLRLPWPKDGSGDEVTLPLWVLILTVEAADRIEALTADREACAVLVSDLLDGYGTDQIDFATFEAVSAAAEAFVARARKGV
jgi:hypothetical protein